VVVSDRCQRKGLGTELTRRLVQIAKNEKLERLVAYTLRENKDMQTMCKKVGFKVRIPVGESESIIEMNL
jgi:acetyltransferase